MNKYERIHQMNLVRYAKQIDAIYDAAVQEMARIGVSLGDVTDALEKGTFSLDRYPKVKERVSALVEQVGTELEACVSSGVEVEWKLANDKNDALVRKVFGDRLEQLTEEQRRRFFTSNADGLAAFATRKEAGLNLSERVWNYANGFKDEIEQALGVSLGQGKAANRLATELKQYLREPNKLFRRVRDANGNLVPSKAMAAYHPGRGVYRSSYMNARRLAVTETNMAYRTSDYMRMQGEDFVVGIEIVLSNNHNCKGVPAGMFSDICDELKGKYPKDFKFTGWHPHCRCHVETILKTEEEMDADFDRILRGEDPTVGSTNEIKDTPDNFNKWMKANEERVANAKSTPYFIKDNPDWLTEESRAARIAAKTEVKVTTAEPKITIGNTKPQEQHIGKSFRYTKEQKINLIKEYTGITSDEEARQIYDSILEFSTQSFSDVRAFQCGKAMDRETRMLMEKYATDVEKFIEKSPKWSGGTTYRGVSLTQDELDDIIKELKAGKGNMMGTSSWSTDIEVAENFAYYNHNKSELKVIFVSEKQTKATSIMHLSENASEREVLISKDCKYKFKSRREEDGYIIIEVEPSN